MQAGTEGSLFFVVVQKGDISELRSLLHTSRLSPEKLRDPRGYSALHVIALNNSPEVAECLFTYIRNNYVSDPDLTIREWVALTTEDGFTCFHFAAFRGSLKLIKMFIAEGADPEVKNKQGLNAMHIAAQGDQPLILAYLQESGLDLNEKDYKGGAALHWAAFMGNEMSAAVLLSWQVEKDYPDSEGHTPLHLAAIAGNSRITRNLLLKGANRHVLDIKGRQPLDIAREAKLSQMVEMLQVPGCFAECSLKPPVRPYRKSLITRCLYLLGFPVDAVLTVLFTIDSIGVIGLAVFLIFAVLSFLFYAITAKKDPGYLKRKDDDSLLKLFERYEPHLICPDCVVWRPARSRHCQCCDRCVEKFDHHCPWLSNCIGARNLGFFYVFLITTLVALAISTAAGLLSAIYPGPSEIINVSRSVKRAIGAAVGSLSCLFLFPVFVLCLIQTQNFMSNTTTNERFGARKKDEDEDLNSSSASLYVNRSSRVRNCVGMCCNAPTGPPVSRKRKHKQVGEELDAHYEDISMERSTSEVLIGE